MVIPGTPKPSLAPNPVQTLPTSYSASHPSLLPYSHPLLRLHLNSHCSQLTPSPILLPRPPFAVSHFAVRRRNPAEPNPGVLSPLALNCSHRHDTPHEDSVTSRPQQEAHQLGKLHESSWRRRKGGSWFGRQDRAGAHDTIMLKRLLGIAAAVALAAVFRRMFTQRVPPELPLIPETPPVPPEPTREVLQSRHLLSRKTNRSRPMRSSPILAPPHPQLRTRRPNLRLTPRPRRAWGKGTSILLRLMMLRNLARERESRDHDPHGQSVISGDGSPAQGRDPRPSATNTPPAPDVPEKPKSTAARQPTDRYVQQERDSHKTRQRRRSPALTARPGRRHPPARHAPPNSRADAPQSKAGLRAHLCVWQQGIGWQLGVEIESAPERILTVQQDGHELERDDLDQDRWLVTDGQGNIEVLDGHECVRQIGNLTRPRHLIFRLVGANLDRGVLVQRPSAGASLLLVPTDWDAPKSDPPELIGEHEEVTPRTFCAYYIHVDSNSAPTVRIADHEDSNTLIRFNEARGRFRLQGPIIENAAPKHRSRSSRQGPLYGPSPPEIATRDWADISTIVVGEEGSGKCRWSDEIKPELHEPSKRLAKFMTMQRAGWFFVRFYDQQRDLVDSIDFRYASGIKGSPQQIESGESSPERKFDIVHIEHEPNVRIEALDPDNRDITSEQATNGGSNFRIPHMKKYDHTEWIIVDGDAKVPLHIELPRFWRRLRIVGNGTSSRWSPKAINLQDDHFKPTQRRVLDVSVPSDASKTALIDFAFPTRRRFRATANREFHVPLWNFFDSNHLTSVGRHVLRLSPEIHSSKDTIPLVNLGILELRTRCSYCSRGLASNSDLSDHVLARHFDEVFVEESYEKTSKQFPNLGLPDAIYVCDVCQEFYLSGHGCVNRRYLQIIQDCTIDDHNDSAHKHAHQNFGPVSDARDVRDWLIGSLPYLYRCTICSRNIKAEKEEKTKLKLLKHLMRFHLRDVSKAI